MYMNISFDGQFALAWSSDPNLDQLEVGDHDPQQRGFNARNLELARHGAVDPYFEGFANIVFKVDNNDETDVEVEVVIRLIVSLTTGCSLSTTEAHPCPPISPSSTSLRRVPS